MRATPMRHPVVWSASPRRRVQSQVGIGNPASVVLRRNGRRSDRNPYSEPVRIGRFSPNLGFRFSLNLGLRFDRGCPPLELRTGFLPGWPRCLRCHHRYISTEALRRQYSYGGSKVVRRRTYGGASVKLWCYVSGLCLTCFGGAYGAESEYIELMGGRHKPKPATSGRVLLDSKIN
jgi:hypothetical protein